MKLDKMKFARLVSYLGTIANRDMDSDELDCIDRIINIDVEPITIPLNLASLDDLLTEMVRDILGHSTGRTKAGNDISGI